MNLEEKEPKKLNSKLKYGLSIAFLIMLIVITFIVIFAKYDIKELFSILKMVELKYVTISIALVFIYILFEGLATRTLLKSVGYKTSVLDNFEYAAVDYYYCAITPSASGGQPMSAYFMAKGNIPLPVSSQVLLVNTALFKMVLITLSIVSLFFSYQYIFDSTLMLVLFIVGIVINVVLITFCLLMSFKRDWIEAIGKRLIMFLVRIKILKRPLRLIKFFTKKMDEYEQGGKLIAKNKGKFALALIYNFIQRIALFSIAYFVYLAFIKTFPELKGFNYFDLFAIQTLIALSVDSLPLPGGMGISEILYVNIFGIIYGGITIFGEGTLVASAMLLTRAVSFYLPLIITAIISIKCHIMVIVKGKRSGGVQKW